MKRTLLLTSLICFFQSVFLFGQQMIAIEHTAGGSSFTRMLDSAVLLAGSGDFIYLPGGSFTLGSTTISKPLTIIGAGHYPDSTMATNPTIISGNISLAEGATGTHLEGFYLTGDVSVAYANVVNQLTVRRCNVNNITANGSHFSQFDLDSTFSDQWNIIHNVVRGGINFANVKAFNLTGNIVNGQLSYANYGGTIENNVFLFSSVSVHFMDEIRNSIFKNNLFLATSELSYANYACYNGPCGSYNNMFYNNAFCMSGQNTYVENGQAAVTQNNIYTADAAGIFLNVSGNTFSYSHNYHLQAGFLSQLTGTDGTEPGIYGTSNPYKEGAVPFNPHISTQQIDAATGTNGQIQINIKVNAQSN